MRVTVSIPDGVFEEAELLAKQLKTTRSDIYARAIDAFIGAHAPDRTTEATTDVEFVRAVAQRVLDRIEW